MAGYPWLTFQLALRSLGSRTWAAVATRRPPAACLCSICKAKLEKKDRGEQLAENSAKKILVKQKIPAPPATGEACCSKQEQHGSVRERDANLSRGGPPRQATRTKAHNDS